MNVASLGALILANEGARTLRRTADSLEIAVDMGTGQNLGVLVREGEVRILTGHDDDSPQVDEEHGEAIEEDDDSEGEDVAGSLISKIQAASGWHVESEHLLGFDPSGVCPACELECFEWQERCSDCDAELEGAEPREPRDPEEPDEGPRQAPPSSARARRADRARDPAGRADGGELFGPSSRAPNGLPRAAPRSAGRDEGGRRGLCQRRSRLFSKRP